MTGEEFARTHPGLAAELDQIGRDTTALIVREHRLSKLEKDVLFGGLPHVGLLALLMQGMTAWGWTHWLIPLAVFFGVGTLGTLFESVEYLSMRAQDYRRHRRARQDG